MPFRLLPPFKKLSAVHATVRENVKLAAEQVKLLHIIGSVIKKVKKYAFRRIIKHVICALAKDGANSVKEKERLKF